MYIRIKRRTQKLGRVNLEELLLSLIFPNGLLRSSTLRAIATGTIIELLWDLLVFVRKKTNLTQWILHFGLPAVQCRIIVCLPRGFLLAGSIQQVSSQTQCLVLLSSRVARFFGKSKEERVGAFFKRLFALRWPQSVAYFVQHGYSSSAACMLLIQAKMDPKVQTS